LYALVAYIKSDLGEFVENLRAELHPKHAHLPAHISILPPRPLMGTEQQALECLRALCSQVVPFEVEISDVETFVPTTPTVFLRIAHRGYRLRELHDMLNCNQLAYNEPLLYMPHVTIAKLDEMDRAREVFDISTARWAAYAGARKAGIEELTFVRGRDHTWTDLDTVRLTGIPK
jgi:2'-5' RNA ligase